MNDVQKAFASKFCRCKFARYLKCSKQYKLGFCEFTVAGEVEDFCIVTGKLQKISDLNLCIKPKKMITRQKKIKNTEYPLFDSYE